MKVKRLKSIEQSRESTRGKQEKSLECLQWKGVPVRSAGLNFQIIMEFSGETTLIPKSLFSFIYPPATRNLLSSGANKIWKNDGRSLFFFYDLSIHFFHPLLFSLSFFNQI